MKETIEEMFIMFGGLTMLRVMDWYEAIEQYEVCHEIKTYIEEQEAILGENWLPDRYDPETYEDEFLKAFNRIGLSGKSALSMNDQRTIQAITQLSQYTVEL